MTETVRKRVFYRGRVQGVGFRATTASLAARFPVAGFVRNLADGSVELVAEGEPDSVEAFLTAVEERFRRHVTDCDVRDATAEEPLSGFAVRP